MKKVMILLSMMFLITTNCMAAADADAAAKAATDAAKLAAQNQFEGLGFGVGVSYTYDLQKTKRIRSAIIDGAGKVRVTEEDVSLARVILETHYFFPVNDRIGFGPFIALMPGTQTVIDAIGAGVMLGLKREKDAPSSSSSFNIGAGVIVDPKVQVLGDGIVENQALPAGETAIRYKSTSQVGILVMGSFRF